MEAAILAIGLAIVAGHLLSAIFKRTRIPDVLVLMLAGIAIGPYALAWASPADFGKVGPVLTTIALIVILFEGGLGLEVATVRRALGETLTLTLTTSVVTAGLVAVIAYPLLGNWITPFLLGVILSGTSSAVVIPMINALGVADRPRAVLALESALTDVTCIVGAFALLQAALAGGELHGMELASRMIASLVVASVMGVAGGIGWLLMLDRVRQLPNSFTLVFAVVFLLYGLAELLGFSGGIAALAFGMTISNVVPDLAARFSTRNPIAIAQHTDQERDLFAEAVFLVKLFFFVYLGLNLRFSDPEVLTYAAATVVAVYAARLLITRFTLSASATTTDATVAAVMVPKGLAAAVLASVPAQQGLAGGEVLRDLAFAVVGMSIVVTSVAVPLTTLAPARWLARQWFRPFATPGEGQP